MFHQVFLSGSLKRGNSTRAGTLSQSHAYDNINRVRQDGLVSASNGKAHNKNYLKEKGRDCKENAWGTEIVKGELTTYLEWSTQGESQMRKELMSSRDIAGFYR